MPTHHRRSSGAFRGSQRRKLVWATTDQSVTLAAGAFTNVNLLAQLATAGSSLLGITIMRTIVKIYATSTLSAGDALAVGCLVVKSSEIGAGVVGAATPAAGELDWIYLTKYYANVGDDENSLGGLMTFDTRAKRKMQELQQAYSLSMLNSVGIAKTLGVFGRVLVALP